MSDEKRSMSAALDAANIVEFIQTGVPTASKDKPVTTGKKVEVQTPPKGAEKISPVSNPKKKRVKPREAAPDVSPDFTRTMAKARVQKSIRFRPDLIARLEKFRRNEEEEGRTPVSIQDAQNEALAMWLDSKKVS